MITVNYMYLLTLWSDRSKLTANSRRIHLAASLGLISLNVRREKFLNDEYF